MAEDGEAGRQALAEEASVVLAMENGALTYGEYMTRKGSLVDWARLLVSGVVACVFLVAVLAGLYAAFREFGNMIGFPRPSRRHWRWVLIVLLVLAQVAVAWFVYIGSWTEDGLGG